MITNREGIIEYVNPAFETLTGYSRQDAEGKTPRLLKSGEQGPETYLELWKTILGGTVYRSILVNRKKNGELYYIEQSISPVRDTAGSITHFISNGRDLTKGTGWKPSFFRRTKWMRSAAWRARGARFQQPADHHYQLL